MEKCISNFSILLLVVHRIIVLIFLFVLYHVILLNLLVLGGKFWEFIEIFYGDSYVICNGDGFLSFFPICMAFTSFPCLMMLARSSSTDKYQHQVCNPKLDSDLRGKTLVIHCEISRFLTDAVYQVEEVSLVSIYLFFF